MPLHLLPKKSWNPYSATAIARVKADEAAAADADRAYAERLAEHEAARRRALLRGEPVPTTRLPSPPRAITGVSASGSGAVLGGRKRHGDGQDGNTALAVKRPRRRQGEDETDWDIRTAKAATTTHASGEKEGDAIARQTQDIMHDARGHMQLFAPPPPVLHNAEALADARRAAERSGADGAGMRFRHAAGYAADITRRPWYYSGTEEVDAAVERQEDDDRTRAKERRQQARMAVNDPMAAMKKGQGRLKEVEREREEWKKEREAEMRNLHEDEERAERKRRRRRELEDRELEGFSLDAPPVAVARVQESRDRKRRQRSREHGGSRPHERQSESRRERHGESRRERHGEPRRERQSESRHGLRHGRRHESRHNEQ